MCINSCSVRVEWGRFGELYELDVREGASRRSEPPITHVGGDGVTERGRTGQAAYGVPMMKRSPP